MKNEAKTELTPLFAKAPAIQITDLSFSYGGKAILNHIRLEVKAGQITALVGPSGCGKSSLLSVINRLCDLHSCEVKGRVVIDNEDILSPTTDVLQLRRQVGMVFQKPNPFPMSIEDNLRFPLQEHGMREKRQLQQRIEECLTLVGLWDEVKDRLNQSALELSGGQQQRLCFARCLSLNPRVLLLDEPCSALDPMSAGIIEELITRLRGQYTILIVTHNLAQARRIADEVAMCWMIDGVGYIVEAGETTRVFDFPKHPVTAAYLGGVVS